MKVHLKTTVIDRILKDLGEARRQRRAVDYITVTHDEFCEMRRDDRSFDYYADALVAVYVSSYEVPKESPIKSRDFKVKDPAIRGMPYIRVIEQGTFMGHPLYVVPEYVEQ